MTGHFTPALFSYLRELKANNTRDWFEDHRARYVAEVETPMREFIAALAPPLRSLSSSLVVDPRRMGGSMYRIHRDTRFSPDKSPYKTYVAARFSHAKQRQAPSVPGFYLHLEPNDSMGGGGIYHPEPPALARIRLAIVEDTAGWSKVTQGGLTIEGDRLVRAPAGFDRSHPLIGDLKMKDFYALVPFSQQEVCAPDFLGRYVESCRTVAPLVAFLTRALGWKW